MPVPTGRLVALVAAASLVAAALTGDVVGRLLVVDGVLALVAACDWALAPARSALTVERRIGANLWVGQRSEVCWDLGLRARFPSTVTVADGFAPSLRAESPHRAVRLVPGSRATVCATLSPSRRGRFVIGPLRCRATGPLGLLARVHRHPGTVDIRVRPRFRSRAVAELQIDRARLLEVGNRSAAGRGGGTSFEELREYSVDDEFRRIDWAATARSSRPIVRTYRAERNQQVILLLDAGRMMAGRIDGTPRLEHAMDAAMVVATVASRLGDRVGLVAFDATPHSVVSAATGTSQVGRIGEALFDLEPNLVQSDYTAAVRTVMARFRTRALVVLLSELADDGVGEALVGPLTTLRRRHAVMVAAVRDPAVAAWADASVTDADAAYRRAAAARTLRERDRIAARLRGVGVRVLDSGADRLARDVGEAYLDLKAVGGL